MKYTNSKLVLFLFSVILSILIIEILLRAFNLVQLTNEYLVKDDYLNFKLRPNITTTALSADSLPFEITTNSLGFNGIGFRDDGINGEPFAVVLDNPNDYTYNYPIDSIKSFCEENQLNCLDLIPVLKEHAIKGEQLFFPKDAHLGELGNQIIADEIFVYLEKIHALK